MSFTDPGIAWDRRRGDRRAGSDGGPGDRRQTSSPAARFEAFLDLALDNLQQDAKAMAGQVAVEADRTRGELKAGDLDRERIDGLAARVARTTEAVADDLARLRRELAEERGDDSSAAPSQGAEMLVRQLALAGADATEIEAELANLGMEHPREAIDRILADQPA